MSAYPPPINGHAPSQKHPQQQPNMGPPPPPGFAPPPPTASGSTGPQAPPKSAQPIGTAIQVSVDRLLVIIEQEKAAAVATERARRKELERHYEAYRNQREAQAAKDAEDIKRHLQEINHLKVQLSHAQNSLAQTSTSALATRVTQLEGLLATARTERDQARADSNGLATLAKANMGSNLEAAGILTRLGIYSPRPGFYCFGGHWPELLSELGIEQDKMWTGQDLERCIQQIVQQLRQSRYQQQGQQQQQQASYPPAQYSNPPSVP